MNDHCGNTIGHQSAFASGPRSGVAGWLMFVAAMLVLLASLSGRALALGPIAIDPEQDRLELTTLGEFYDARGDSLQVETAPAADGMSGRMSVSARTPGTSPNWVVFALTNPTDKPIERWLTAARYNIVGSGAVWPDLDAKRIEAVTPSMGFIPERIKSDRADIFRITIEPGQTVTYVVELAADRFARIYLWKPFEYELYSRDRQLMNGIMLGLTGLLAIFLTAIFAANHKAIFPSAALVAWCVLAYLCVDFGFFHKLFQLKPEDNAVYRAASEAAVAASLVVFISVFLRIAFWHGLIRMLFTVWIIAQLTLVAVAIIDPRLASTFARMSFLVIGGVGGAFALFLAVRGQDRALSLIPTWILFLIWIFGASMVLTGRISGDAAVQGLVAGLVLILILIGFTVTQFAFRSLEPLFGTTPSELQLRALAVDGAGSAVWEWSARRDEVKVSPAIEASLGLNPGELCTKVDDFIKHLHPTDRERFRTILWSVQERTWARIRTDFRMRHTDNSYRWFELEAASVPNADARSMRCVGLVRDVTDAKRAHERLLHDAVHDSLTGLPNRELLLDRLGVAITRTKTEIGVRPSVMVVDIDKFKAVNVSFGLVVGDSLLLTIARRLQSHLGPHDTLARVGGDQFAILMIAGQSPQDMAGLAERVRRSLRAPIKIAGQEIVLTGSIGIAVYDGATPSHLDLYKEAEIAMHRAKRGGADRIEIFRPDMRSDRDDRVALENDLRKALAKNQIKILYQPIIYLPTEELAGFEAMIRWEHPKRGLLAPEDFIPAAEESDLIVRLGSHVLLRAAQDAARWQRELPRDERPLFVSVNICSSHIFQQNLIQEVRHILGRNIVPKGSLRLEISESLVMENPERATEILEWLRGAGAGLALDEFGTGYSSLAYLQRFPFDTIKVDRALVQAGGDSGSAGSAIVRSIVALGHELGKSVVAEGVETSEDVAFLRSISCQYAQGFYYGEPMADRDVQQLLKMVRTAEHKLRPRGLFRNKVKSKSRNKGQPGADEAQADVAAAAGNAVTANGATPPPRPGSNGILSAAMQAAGAGNASSGPLRSRIRTQPPGGNGAGPGRGVRPPPPAPVALTNADISAAMAELVASSAGGALATSNAAIPPGVMPNGGGGMPPRSAPNAAGGMAPDNAHPSQQPVLRGGHDLAPPPGPGASQTRRDGMHSPAPSPAPMPMQVMNQDAIVHGVGFAAAPPSAMPNGGRPVEHQQEPAKRPDFTPPPARSPTPMTEASASPFDAFVDPPLVHAAAQSFAPPASGAPMEQQQRHAGGVEGNHAQHQQNGQMPPQHGNESIPTAVTHPAPAPGNAAAFAPPPQNAPTDAPARRTPPDFASLPPTMAASLAKLAGVPWPPREEDERELADHAAGGRTPPRQS
ncbi:diguanylate cyclase/phosphodiesterase (GGDEF & EAL domains) with PAS/PAC sensor(s) [Hyphomicrobium sulfonivorans]|uniref:Diguanylate cyclase/phosphodiesterase (GGDEF & EAL domains) with PAS/PAC sensor(S) n=1 Tax=Hyphomicrobium sulfonivorans TaxID=121290 RepID=A0A109BDU8_HYPSL|nr:EAL domain-containing protein [Hyphomicrobium sulfonivorans]KWT66725.1 diguanylate cyclase/phosphodiesterase (GGDEF & EAL domains) with PAS/PAC sensor(s) [Hyphomicrobium sulfonivorans]